MALEVVVVTDVGSGQWCFSLVHQERRQVLARLRQLTSYTSGFPDPREVAFAISLSTVAVPALPGGLEQLTDGRTLWVLDTPDQRVRGTRIFRGIASAVLGIDGSTRSVAYRDTLAGRLAAPPFLMSQLGLEESIRRQRWATEDFLAWCWSSRMI